MYASMYLLVSIFEEECLRNYADFTLRGQLVSLTPALFEGAFYLCRWISEFLACLQFVEIAECKVLGCLKSFFRFIR